ncbi:hypothetical protein [Thetidibacter halocola]|uniref:Uncharacterized protein n=1 Tax=Thetidibacter halocola TaxID=2827239 RepID=A0A8J7W9S7_9RHOB|nr:hypothetical protein [Thetidibacter halocola]MBS0123530.1 hypothetical protein [Thetidibacter halocola]
MPLQILITLVVAGIAGIAALTWALGMATPRRFVSDSEAIAAFAREFPETPVRAVTRCRDGQAALLRTDSGVALVWPMGADSTARLLSRIRVDRTRHGLTLHLPDYTAPRVSLRLPKDEADRWQTLLRQAT